MKFIFFVLGSYCLANISVELHSISLNQTPLLYFIIVGTFGRSDIGLVTHLLIS